jgi:hypothetical protein
MKAIATSVAILTGVSKAVGGAKIAHPGRDHEDGESGACDAGESLAHDGENMRRRALIRNVLRGLSYHVS